MTEGSKSEKLYKKFSKMSANEFLHTIMLENGFSSKKAVADYLGVTKTRISAWTRDGKVPEKHVRRFAMELSNNNKNDIDITNSYDLKLVNNKLDQLILTMNEILTRLNQK